MEGGIGRRHAETKANEREDAMKQELSPTLEDYLETIYRIEREKRVARPRDICRAQNVAASTVTAALQSLAEKGLINYEPYELITLTDQGRKRGKDLATRHRIIKDFLENVLDLGAEGADATACRLEHLIDREALERFICFLAYMRSHSQEGAKWLESFRRFTKEGTGDLTCKECVDQYMKSIQKQS